jgi:hypothetical protein
MYARSPQSPRRSRKEYDMKFKDRLAKLIDVKTIVTLTLTAVFSYLSIIGKISADNFMTVFTVIISFFFGVQIEKNNNRKE